MAATGTKIEEESLVDSPGYYETKYRSMRDGDKMATAVKRRKFLKRQRSKGKRVAVPGCDVKEGGEQRGRYSPVPRKKHHASQVSGGAHRRNVHEMVV